MDDPSLQKDILPYKISQYAHIPYRVDLSCVCGKSTCYGLKEDAILIGWCEAETGFMMVYACPVCHELFRCHCCTTERNSYKMFSELFNLHMFLQEQTQ